MHKTLLSISRGMEGKYLCPFSLALIDLPRCLAEKLHEKQVFWAVNGGF